MTGHTGWVVLVGSRRPKGPLRVPWGPLVASVAVRWAEADGLTWQQIADAIGLRMRHAQTKFSDAKRQRRYRARKQAEG